MQYLLGCLGIIILIAIVIAVIQWFFQNIVGLIGLRIAIWGAYKWFQNKGQNIKSKIPIITAIIGLLICIGWFAGSSSTDTELTEEAEELENESSIEITEEEKEIKWTLPFNFYECERTLSYKN